MISSRVQKIFSEIGDKAKLVAVSKGSGLNQIKQAKEAGVYAFAENRIDEAEEKIPFIDAEWHFIGTLQSNKIKRAVELFDVLQSVSSIKEARLIDSEAAKLGKRMKIMLQINLGADLKRQGVLKQELHGTIKEVKKLRNLELIGLMIMPPPGVDSVPYFKTARQIFDKYEFDYLSMGMSDDYQHALKEGSNLIRVGRAIFGER